MKHFFAFCKRNRLFAALLAVELAVLCVLAAGLFGAPYKLTLLSVWRWYDRYHGTLRSDGAHPQLLS